MNVGACTSLPITTAIGRLDLRIGVSLIGRNPCRIKGASVETSSERPVLTAPQVFDLAAAIDPRYRARNGHESPGRPHEDRLRIPPDDARPAVEAERPERDSNALPTA